MRAGAGAARSRNDEHCTRLNRIRTADTPMNETYDQLRADQGGTGKIGSSSALACGSTTVGLALRICSTAMLVSGFWPLASKWMGPPIITRLPILVAFSASTSA